jgi:paraquat-inducible protein B
MSQKAHNLKTGIFVLVGFAIALGVILVIGSGRLFARRVPVIVYFDSSVNGLSVGAPVKFKGVPIGEVKRIRIAFDEDSIRQSIPVLLELDEERVVTTADQALDLGDRVFMRQQVDRGLRASLEIESVITGRLYVQLDYIPNAAPPRFLHRTGTYIEIPTVSTGLSEFVESLTRTDIAGLAADLRTLMRTVDEAVKALEVTSIRSELVTTLKSMQSILGSPSLTNAIHSLTLTSDEARSFIRRAEPKLGTLGTDVTRFTDETVRTLAGMRDTLDGVSGVLAPDSLMLGRLEETLESLASAARSIERFADSLNRTPSALISGRIRRPDPSTAPATP